MYNRRKIRALIEQVATLKNQALETERHYHTVLQKVHPAHLLSARNLLHYLSVRTHDLRMLQQQLSRMAISSQSHSESYTLDSLEKIEYLLHALDGQVMNHHTHNIPDNSFSTDIIRRNADALLGKAAYRGQSRIMVTLPSEAADDYNMIRHLIKAGMHIARINTAHDDEDTWEKMVANIRRASDTMGRNVKIYMDTQGPKIRTAAIKVKDSKDKAHDLHLYKGSRLRITANELSGSYAQPVISISMPEIIKQVKRNDTVWFDDGKLGGRITATANTYFTVEITEAPEDGIKLKPKKGINFPDTPLDIPALTAKTCSTLHLLRDMQI